MNIEKLRIDGTCILDADSGMQLRAISVDDVADNIPWISGWFKDGDGKLIIQKFTVLNAGKPTYRMASRAVDFWGAKVLGIPEADAIEMSPAFGANLLIPAVRPDTLMPDGLKLLPMLSKFVES